MKVKEIEKTANIAWSPSQQHPIFLAAGTAAQQFDATFSTSAALDIFQLDLSDVSLEMKQVGTLPSEQRFHKLAWGSQGLGGSETPSGVLIGGTDNGNIHVWNAEAIVKGTDPVITNLNKHTGAVAALDFNPFQSNLLASGASESEIFIWDLNNTANAMTPGAKSQPPDDVTCVAWNQQVQHILASTYAGRCVVWDLRKNEPIIKVSDSMSRIKCKLVAWHPDVATQMCLASEDDHSPIIQLWDLRFATSPLKTLENHTRGILSMAWCPQDPDLLLSCGKDNRILCWNPNTAGQTGEVVYELPTSNQWSFDVQWCPRNPAIISSCSFDGHVSVYSLMGGGKAPEPSSKIADSFPTDPFAQPPPQREKTESAPVQALKKPPKWLRRPVGASFAFGGKLVTFEHTKPSHPQQPTQKLVQISQVVTETDLIARSSQLEHAVNNNQFAEFCSMKIANSKNDMEENIWNFLKVPFEGDPRTRYLQLLGYDQQDLSKKVAEYSSSEQTDLQENGGVDADELAQKMAQLNSGSTPSSDSFGGLDGSSAFDQIASQDQDSRPDSPLPISTDDALKIPNTDVDGLVTQALLMANFEAAVQVCLSNERLAEAIVLAIAGGPELLARTQKKVFQASKSSLNRLISSVVTKDFEHVIRTCDLDSWKEALALALTYCRGQQFSSLCELLGVRLESERDGELAINACLCYICAGNVERLVSCWDRITESSSSPLGLQDLVEKVMVLRRAVECAAGQAMGETGPLLADKLSRYADLLAAQGNLTTALGYLGESAEMPLATLRDRLTSSLGMPAGGRPFHVINVQPVLPPRQVAQPAVPASAPGNRQRTPSGHYQAQAGSTFQTSTTATSMYSAGPSAYPQPNAPVQNQPYYQPVSTAQPAPAKQGTLASKYGSYTSQGQGSTQPTSVYNPYSQPAQPKPQTYAYDTSYQNPVATSQPAMYNPAVSQETPECPPSPPYKVLTPRRPSRYNDSESIAGIAMASPPHSRRHSIYSTEQEGQPDKGAPSSYVPPTSAAVPSYQEMRPQAAWNDPPIVMNKKAEPKPYEPPAPITQPLFGAQQEQAPPGAPNYGGTQLYNPANYQAQPPTQVQQPANPTQAQHIHHAQPPPEPPKPVEKGPIPAEHKILQEVFDRLANLCLNGTTHLQTKRKLEDVLRKLEALYDKLREHSLSPGIVMGLHQVVQYVQAYDYQNGLAYVTQLISQSNFSEISSFMPGVKMLLQTAMHMQVYLQ